ncbi:BspA family leucine-rich repeat surface protein [Williamsoniiplasma luminosum]|uniref:BspA family leucine-rich repeat surface protein n=1 Tax=Williamsoniiplasma luminosum TaxID=214888 RepID=A0A2S0NKE3_9MOLU|nr:BspA family leucine-rich repeat surface protein [Williamsoniiplasma luminosum]AVP49481.1 MAG: hypothetical protein C5T88_02795 [Williamsoniiplasma luminosum]
MKKLLSLLAAVSLSVPTTLLVVSCGIKIISLSELKTNIGAIDGLDKRYIVEGIRKANPSYTLSANDLEIDFETLQTVDGEPRTGSVDVQGKGRYHGSLTVNFTLNKADLKALKELVKKAEKEHAQGSKLDDAWFTFNQEIGFAKGVIGVGPLAHKQTEIDAAFYRLQTAIIDFDKARTKKVDLWMLNANIDSAKKAAENDRKKPEALEKLKNEITKAEQIRDKAVNEIWEIDKQDDVDKVADNLWNQVFTFIMSPNVETIPPGIDPPHPDQNNLNLGYRMQANILENEYQQPSDQLVLEGENMSINTSDVDNSYKTPQQDLEALLKQANALGQNDKAFDEYLKLKRAIGLAEGILSVYENETENEGVLTQTITELQSAINTFTESKDLKADKATDKLKARMEVAKSALNNGYFKPTNIINELKKALDKANGIANPILGISQEHKVHQAINDLQLALIKFHAAANDSANYKELDKTISNANTILKNEKDNKIQSVVAMLEHEIVIAQEVCDKNLTSDQQDQVDKANNGLKTAIEEFKKVENNKKEIKELIKVTDLGQLKDKELNSIKDAVIIKNRGASSIDFEVDPNSISATKATIKGIGNYKGRIEVNFTSGIQHISVIKYELEQVLDKKQSDFWSKDDLEKEFVKEGFDKAGGISVSEVRTLVEYSVQVRWFKVKGNAEEKKNDFNYGGDIRIFQILRKSEQSNTIYIDAWNEIRWVNGPIDDNSNGIVNLGWDENGNAYNVPKTTIEVPNYISPRIKSLSGLFMSAEWFKGDISKWNTSNVTNMSNMFNGATSFNGDISNWDTSNVTSFEKLFWKARKFNQDISKWNTSKVTDMRNVFDQAEAFNQNIKTNGNSWNVSNVTDMSTMFWGAKAFNQDISNWNVGNVKAHKEFDDGANPNWKKEHKPNFKKS